MANLTITELLSKYNDNDKARQFFESIRWANGVVCPHCKSNEAHKLTAQKGSKSPVRNGVYFCGNCRKQFTVSVGTVMESSHIPLNKWLAAFFLICASKKAISSLQLQRMLGITYKSAWFMSHRIRHAMEDTQNNLLTGTVEIDETYVGGKIRPLNNPTKSKKKDPNRRKKNWKKKTSVVALVSRDGKAKTMVAEKVTRKNIIQTIKANVEKQSSIRTDESSLYNTIGLHFDGGHETVKHSIHEYVRGKDIHTNTVESFFSLLKRGIYGNFHHVSRQHLQKYSNEFAFRWNNRKISDGERMLEAIKMMGGKRLTYRDSSVS